MSNSTDKNMNNQQPMAPSAPPHYADDEIDLKELFMALWRGKWIIIATTFIAAVIAVVYALSLPNIYKSEALLAPAESGETSQINDLVGKFGGIASIAGLDVANDNNTVIALELLKSRLFISEFIQKNELKPIIFATSHWERETNQLVFDSELYNAESKLWVRDVEPPKQPEPTTLEVYNKFIEDNLMLTQDKETGLVKLVVEHESPVVAQQLTDELISSLNDSMRSSDIAEAEESIKYLTSAIEKTAVADMHQIFYQLIEQQQQKKMLATVRKEYVFKTIDPAVVAEEKSGPRRALICMLFVLFGGVLSSAFIIIRHNFCPRKIET